MLAHDWMSIIKRIFQGDLNHCVMPADICSFYQSQLWGLQTEDGYLSLQMKDVSDNLFNFLLWIFLLTVEMYHACDNDLAIWKSLWSNKKTKTVPRFINESIFIVIVFQEKEWTSMFHTSEKRFLAIVTRCCSPGAHVFIPTGSRRFRVATIRLVCFEYLSIFFFIFFLSWSEMIPWGRKK